MFKEEFIKWIDEEIKDKQQYQPKNYQKDLARLLFLKNNANEISENIKSLTKDDLEKTAFEDIFYDKKIDDKLKSIGLNIHEAQNHRYKFKFLDCEGWDCDHPIEDVWDSASAVDFQGILSLVEDTTKPLSFEKSIGLVIEDPCPELTYSIDDDYPYITGATKVTVTTNEARTQISINFNEGSLVELDKEIDRNPNNILWKDGIINDDQVTFNLSKRDAGYLTKAFVDAFNEYLEFDDIKAEYAKKLPNLKIVANKSSAPERDVVKNAQVADKTANKQVNKKK